MWEQLKSLLPIGRGTQDGMPLAANDKQAPLTSQLSAIVVVLLVAAVTYFLFRLDALADAARAAHKPASEVLYYIRSANYIIVICIGLATGATELMSRFQDRPFAALTSKPGLAYMALNGGAAALAYYLMVWWNIGGSQAPGGGGEIQRVLIAGAAAMAFFRSGFFTTRVNDKDVSFGPNLVLQVVLDALDRAVDRERANQRARLIVQIMGGVDFGQAKVNLTELCFSLMQNVRDDERTRLMNEIDEISKMDGLSDEARSMALGLRLMTIVGEDTLDAAGRNLGTMLYSFTALSTETTRLLAQIAPSDILENLLKVCNFVSHKRAQQSPDELEKIVASINALTSLSETPRATLIAYEARRIFGEKVLAKALEMLPKAANPAPPAAPPAPPPSSASSPAAPAAPVSPQPGP